MTLQRSSRAPFVFFEASWLEFFKRENCLTPAPPEALITRSFCAGVPTLMRTQLTARMRAMSEMSRLWRWCR